MGRLPVWSLGNHCPRDELLVAWWPLSALLVTENHGVPARAPAQAAETTSWTLAKTPQTLDTVPLGPGRLGPRAAGALRTVCCTGRL